MARGLKRIQISDRVFYLVVLSVCRNSLQDMVFAGSYPSLSFQSKEGRLLNYTPNRSRVVAKAYGVRFLDLFLVHSRAVLYDDMKGRGRRGDRYRQRTRNLCNNVGLIT